MVINSYTNALLDQWKKVFGVNHVNTRKSVKDKIVKIVKSYHSDVYNKGKFTKMITYIIDVKITKNSTMQILVGDALSFLWLLREDVHHKG